MIDYLAPKTHPFLYCIYCYQSIHRVRYLLDNFVATVEEAIDGMEAIKINKAELCWTSDNMEIGVHLAIQDATGKIYCLREFKNVLI